MFDVTVAHVQHTYEAVREALRALSVYKHACGRFAECGAEEARKCVEVLESAEAELEEKGQIAAEAFEHAKALAEGAMGEAFMYRDHYAPSLGEIVVRAYELDRTEVPWANGLDIEDEEQRKTLGQVSRCFFRTPDRAWPNRHAPEYVDTLLRLECAVVRERVLKYRHEPRLEEKGLWRIEGRRVLFEGPLEDLSGRPKELLEYLVVRRGRPVTLWDLGNDVWEVEHFRNDTISDAMYGLRRELTKRGLPELAEALKAKAGQYLLPTVLPIEEGKTE